MKVPPIAVKKEDTVTNRNVSASRLRADSPDAMHRAFFSSDALRSAQKVVATRTQQRGHKIKVEDAKEQLLEPAYGTMPDETIIGEHMPLTRRSTQNSASSSSEQGAMRVSRSSFLFGAALMDDFMDVYPNSSSLNESLHRSTYRSYHDEPYHVGPSDPKYQQIDATQPPLWKIKKSLTRSVSEGGVLDVPMFDQDVTRSYFPSYKADTSATFALKFAACFDPTHWLTVDLKHDVDGNPYFAGRSEWTIAGFVRHYVYNPVFPEFSSVQNFVWAVILGVVMGMYTAVWKTCIERSVQFVWETLPEFLLKMHVFTEPSGAFPLYHYMWICPMLFASILSYAFLVLRPKLPDQDEWINNVHTRGVQDYRTFLPLFVLSTAGMASGLSLGPELPLVLTSGMMGSYLGLLCKQSILSARVLNLTAASAAVGGYFGFPMAGALFVLEIPVSFVATKTVAVPCMFHLSNAASS
jgi:hypothetical protein